MTAFAHDSQHLAQIYDRVSDFQLDEGKRLVERLGLDEGARVLDVGCGTGRLARWIAERLGPKGSVVGIDPLEHRISVARSHAGAVRFEVGQAEDLGAFEDSSFDAVCLSSVLHWVADKASALAEIRRVLRPGGRVAMTTLPLELSRAGTVALVLQPLLQRPPYADRVKSRPLSVRVAADHQPYLLGAHPRLAARANRYTVGTGARTRAHVDHLRRHLSDARGAAENW